MKWSRFAVTCPSAAVEAVVGIMLEVTGSGPVVEDAGDRKRVSVYVAAGPEAEGCYIDLRTRLMDVPRYLAGDSPLEISHEVVEDQDWEQTWKEFYYPVRVGRRLVIKPTWYPWPPDDRPDAARPDDIVIELDPEMAFGTGSHPSTRLCLVALEDLVAQGDTVLDVGCGSGILTLAAIGLGAADVTAVDVDPVAVATTRANVARNGAAERVHVRRGDIHSVDAGEFRMIVANINGPVVCEIAPEAYRKLRLGGYFIASGLVEHSASEVTRAQQAAGFIPADLRRQDGWACLIGRKGG